MNRKDLVDRTEVVKLLKEAAEQSRKTEDGKACYGIAVALNELNRAASDNGWNEVGEQPAGVMLNLEITEGDKQFVNRGWWDGEKFKNTVRIFSPEVVTGWQKLPEPRKEKICTGKR